MHALRKWLLAGLLVIVPVAITVSVLRWIIDTLDQTLLILPQSWHPDRLFGFHIPGFGVLLTLAILLIVGATASNFLGKKLMHLGDRIVARIPVVRSIYSSVKQVSDTLFSESGNAFRKAVLVQWPRADVWTIAFVTGTPGGDVTLPARRGIRQRLRSHHAQPHGRLFRDAAQERLHRTEDERRRRAEIRRLHGCRLPADRPEDDRARLSAREPKAISMQQMRTTYCGLVTEALMGQTVSLCGWVNRRRDHGGVIFVDLRDREGYVQVVCDPDRPEMFKTAEGLRNEFCVQVKGLVRARPAGTVNDHLKSGAIEVLCQELIVLNPSVTPPFQLDDENLSETTRLLHRVLDLRRPYMQNNLMLRYRVTMEVRKFLDANGFIDIETPMLTKSTPEGARDYLVPSRVHDGMFFALPQSPQLFKQLLMVSGFDRYYQITKCFRDEDLRADRQPEFADRRGDLLPDRGGDPDHVRGHDPQHLQERDQRRHAGLPGDDARRRHAPVRLRQAGPAREAGVHRTHRRDEGRGLQGLLRPGQRRGRPRGRPARAGRRRDEPRRDRRLHRVREDLRRQGAWPGSRSTTPPPAAKACSRRS